MKLLGRKTSFRFSRRSSSDPKASSEGSDGVAAPARLLLTACSSPAQTRRNSLKEAWATIKKVAKKRASLPEYLNRRRHPSPPPAAEPQAPPTTRTTEAFPLPEIPSYEELALRRRQERDEKDGAFGDCMFELMKRCPRYHKYLCRETKEQLVREGRADPSILIPGTGNKSNKDDDSSNEDSDDETSQTTLLD